MTRHTLHTLNLAALVAAALVNANAHGGSKHYRGRWTFTQNVATRCNDFHIKVDVESPAFVIPAYNFVKDRFAMTSYTLDGADFRANWESPSSDILFGQTIDIGFDFKTDKPFSVTDAYWTLNGQTVDSWHVDTAPITFKTVGRAEHFDDYFPGPLGGQDGWEAWDHDPIAGNFQVVPFVAQSAPHALEIDQADDAVLRLDDLDFDDGGQWVVSAWQYIPADFTTGSDGDLAGSYFILLNTYEANGPYHWSVQIQADPNDQQLKVFHGDGVSTVAIPYETDRWVQIQSIVDLDHDWTQVYYDNELVAEYSWTGGVLGDGGGALEIAAVDLYANGSSPVFYDDILIEKLPPAPAPPCPADLDGDGSVGFSDLLEVLSAWGICDGACDADVNDDGVVDFGDLLELLSNWGPCD